MAWPGSPMFCTTMFLYYIISVSGDSRGDAGEWYGERYSDSDSDNDSEPDRGTLFKVILVWLETYMIIQ